jgi:hypothetical protein
MIPIVTVYEGSKKKYSVITLSFFSASKIIDQVAQVDRYASVLILDAFSSRSVLLFSSSLSWPTPHDCIGSQMIYFQASS